MNDKLDLLINEVKKAVLGKDDVIKRTIVAILAEGHILFEDIPGVGKTNLAVAFTKALSLNYQRVQLTSDILPSDLLGYSVYDFDSKKMSFKKGPVFTNIFLADEINRTSSKTQSALLQVMEEGIISVDGNTYPTSKPFIVIATQNPFGSAGTQMLPDSQLDRFMMRLSLGYPDEVSEIEIINRKKNSNPLDNIEAVITPEELVLMQKEIKSVHIDESLVRYIVQVVQQTRKHEKIEQGASPRASIALTKASQATAYLYGRDYVVIEDINENLYEVLNHRIFLIPSIKKNRKSFQIIMEEIMMRITPVTYK
ncbi:MoxR family ATPase [Thomasclavelia cocleata]|uniref:MoxR-like ATPase n=1 Tax=Thomasclavelia cocleata TaxID=69824 RepID=A0A1I0FV53_9FIRM|nr:MoxR family ATPase [Thomasclavelia cocleata]MCR1960981.1 MoxR family ATPase [Thomasclavelia cocleata]NDO43033.1 MoxR family ATPase [Thomasclavelia cocleata]PJN79499.1 MoxR family ATPase [Thomasclavelia cocleata]SET62118.1 MoxR-like ATPase [Thomasclavelia cocleata]